MSELNESAVNDQPFLGFPAGSLKVKPTKLIIQVRSKRDADNESMAETLRKEGMDVWGGYVLMHGAEWSLAEFHILCHCESVAEVYAKASEVFRFHGFKPKPNFGVVLNFEYSATQ